MSRGLTLIELLLVISIIAILAGASTPFLSSTLTRNQASNAQDRVLGSLRKAQTYSMTRRLGEDWGVCLTGGSVRLYAGSCSSPLQEENWTVPGVVSISGLDDISFSGGRGEPSDSAEIVIDSGVSGSTIVVNQAGGIYVE
jgi:prepilin-type N-terminal cleavage/methylation domain-containing protein